MLELYRLPIKIAVFKTLGVLSPLFSCFPAPVLLRRRAVPVACLSQLPGGVALTNCSPGLERQEDIPAVVPLTLEHLVAHIWF